MSFANNIYTDPGVYTRTLFDSPATAILSGLRFPVLIGTGSEILQTRGLEVIRGSSAEVGVQVPRENVAGRAVSSVLPSGQVLLTDFDGTLDRVQVKHFPLVNPENPNRPASRSNHVAVTINGTPIVPLNIDAQKGILRLSTPPQAGDDVRVTYTFRRTDTQFTDDVSEQITAQAPTLFSAISQPYEIEQGVNDTLTVVVDDTATVNVTLDPSAPGAPWTAAQVASFINAAAGTTSLSAGTYTNNLGQVALALSADRNLRVASGSANSTLGLSRGQDTGRNRTFFVFQGPIVDGSNGGITTTDPSDVVVLVDGQPVQPTAVDGQARAVTLPFAPAVGSEVKVTYFQNTWQGTFDYLRELNVTEVIRAGDTPGRNDYIQGADFVLSDDKILWGTAALVRTGVVTQGAQFFGEEQVTPTLVDMRQHLAPCAPVVDTGVSPPVQSKREFRLPLTPTSGNGRSTPLGSDLFAAVTNGRIDLPTDRPDLVKAYWGFSAVDALERGPVTVVKVDSSTSTITLADPVPPGASVFASFYYNTIGDQEYTLTVDTPGASGVGTYTVRDEAGEYLHTATFGSKSAGLTGVTVQFPSGSERTPDARIEAPFSTALFKGPVDEDVSITFEAKDSTLGVFAVGAPGPYSFIDGASDRFRVLVDGQDLDAGLAGISLSSPSGALGLGFHAVHVGGEVTYDATNDYAVTSANNQLDVNIDGVLLQARIPEGATTLEAYAGYLNKMAQGESDTVVAATAVTVVLDANASPLDGTYEGWKVRIVAGLGAGQEREVSSYAGLSRTATVDAAWDVIPDNTSEYMVFNPAHLPRYVAATRFTSPVTITAGEYDTFVAHYTGDNMGASGPLAVTIPAGTYNSAGQLANAVQSAIDTIAFTLGFSPVTVQATSNGELVFRLLRLAGDSAGMMEFLSITSPTNARNILQVVSAMTAGDEVTVGSDTLTAVTGAPSPGEFQIDQPLDDVAASLAAAIDALGAYSASSSGTEVEVEVVASGSPGNLVTITTNLADSDSLAVASTNFFGGADGPESDFTALAGISTGAAPGGSQVKLVDGPVAQRFTSAGDQTGALKNDRLILRNRLVPGSGSLSGEASAAQAVITIGGGSGNTNCGLTTGDSARGSWTATTRHATVLARTGLVTGQATGFGDARDSQPLVRFHADGGSEPQNNVLKVTYEGVPVTVSFTDATGAPIASGDSADVPLGPASIAGTVLNQIATAMASAGLGASAAAVLASGALRQEGAGFRITGQSMAPSSAITVGSGSANGVFGLAAGQEARPTPVEVGVMASALMSENGNPTNVDVDQFLSWEVPSTWNSGEVFARRALAYVTQDIAGVRYLTLQSKGTVSRGPSSSISVAAANTRNVYLQGTGFDVSPGEGGAGEAGINGFYVTSTDTVDGSGTANTSRLNPGSGQDGLVGQTYRDAVTGLTFTILPREGGSLYPSGETVMLRVRRVATTDSNLPVRTVPGLELLVTDTGGMAAGDTAVVSTFQRGGQEPSIGDSYYVTYNYRKDDFSTRLFTSLRAVEAEYGDNIPDNPVVLAAFLAFINGAPIVGIKQVEKDVDQDGDGIGDAASLGSYINAVQELEGALPGGILPTYMVPVGLPSGNVTEFFSFLARHCDLQSTLRARAERTAICGFPAGTTPKSAADTASAVSASRLRVVYPDIVTVTLDQADGAEDTYLVDGSFLAAALAGVISAPLRDVATPWTGLRIFGFDNLGRELDPVAKNQTAVRGVTVLEDRPSFIRVRQGFTTDMDNLLTRTPTVIQISDFIQQQSRQELDRFIGVKFLPGILSQIEGGLANVLRLAVQAEILAAYTNVRAQVAGDDPTTAEVSAAYQPVFPLLYIIVQFNLRSSL